MTQGKPEPTPKVVQDFNNAVEALVAAGYTIEVAHVIKPVLKARSIFKTKKTDEKD